MSGVCYCTVSLVPRQERAASSRVKGRLNGEHFHGEMRVLAMAAPKRSFFRSRIICRVEPAATEKVFMTERPQEEPARMATPRIDFLEKG